MDVVLLFVGFIAGCATCIVIATVVWAAEQRRIDARIAEATIVRRLTGEPDPRWLAESDFAVDPAEYFGPTPDELRRLVAERPQEDES